MAAVSAIVIRRVRSAVFPILNLSAAWRDTTTVLSAIAIPTSPVSGASNSYYVGGLAGRNEGIVSRCYAAGLVSGSDIIGGLVGNNGGNITNCSGRCGQRCSKKPLILLAGWICFGLAGISPAVAESVIAPGAKLEKLTGDLKFGEGPTCDANGNVFFTDQPNDRILEWSEDGKLSTFMQPAGRANGMCFDAKGNLIACADEKNELWSITPDKKVTVLVKGYQGKYLNGPNDVWIAPDGGMYITDPFYKRLLVGS